MNDMQQKKTSLVLFDFDGTLTQGDSFGRILWYAVPFQRLLVAGFKLLFFVPKLLFIPASARAERAKRKILQLFLGAQHRDALEALGRGFYQQQLPAMLRPALMALLRRYKAEYHTVVLVSASLDFWLLPLCTAEGIALICTNAAYENDLFTGHFSTPNCNRAEKARRIREIFDLEQFDRVIAYGNSSGDAAMLALAQEAWWCNPDGSLKKL